MRKLGTRCHLSPRARTLRLAWQRRWHAEHGNGAPSAGQFSVLSWNARALDASLASGEAREKLAVLRGVMLEQRPTVVAIFEVIAAGASLAERLSSFRALRRQLSELSYASVLLPGEGRGGRNAVVVAVSKRQAKLMEFRRVSSRALGFRVLHKRESCERHLVALHGPTSDTGDAGAGRQFKATLSSADSWLRARGGGLLFGDFNRVPCAEWRASRAPLDSADRALRTLTRWSCECCRRVGDPSASDANTIAGGDGGIGSDSGWTRYATHASVLGAATSRIDLAVTIGGGAVWTEQANILPINGGTRSEGWGGKVGVLLSPYGGAASSIGTMLWIGPIVPSYCTL